LLVVDITEEGNRRPIKVARLYPLGQQRILAQLKLPDLVQLKGWKLVLSGIEELPGRRKSKSRRWTNLGVRTPPAGKRSGLQGQGHLHGRRPSAARGAPQTTGTRGTLLVAGEHSNALQRHTTCAEVHHHQISTFPAKRLINCHIEFMGESTFGLGGLHVREAHQEAPQRLEAVRVALRIRRSGEN
jgi:hypothetical protein